jgi:DNA-binding NarL/FixJ family response regulator
LTESGAATVLIADDQNLFRSGLAALLDKDPRVTVVGQAVNGEEAVRMVDELRPNLVLMDLKMPVMEGVEATRLIRGQHPEIAVIILSSFGGDSYLLQALEAGASGYVLKDTNVATIVNSMLAIVGGATVISGAIADRLLGMLSTKPKESFDGLTPREVEILKLVAVGLANKQIAYRLKVSEKTVRNHISNVYEKLGIQGRSHAVIYAARKGLIEL